GMLAEAGEAADTGHAIALPGNRYGASAARPQKEAFVRPGATERAEEGDVTTRVHRRDDGPRPGAEATEHAAARRGIAGCRHAAQGGRLVAGRRRRGQDRDRRQRQPELAERHATEYRETTEGSQC